MILFFACVFLAGDVSLWNLSFSYTSVANANLLCNLTPFTVIPLSYLLFKEKVPMSFLLSACITFIGVLVLLDGKASPNPDNFFGDFLAVCASVFYAGTITLMEILGIAIVIAGVFMVQAQYTPKEKESISVA